MLNQGARDQARLASFPSQLLVAGACGLLLGLIASWISPLWTLAVLLGGALAFATLKRPEIGLLGILLAISSIIFEGSLPLVSIGFGSLHVPDIILLSLFGIIIVRRLAEPDFRIVRTPLDVPFLAFYAVCLVSTMIAVLRGSVDVGIVFRAIRVVTYYLTFFAVTNLIRGEHQLKFLMRGSVLLAAVVAVAMVAQSWLGESNAFLPGRVETLATQGASFSGVFRILPPGQSLVLVMFIASGVLLVLNKPKAVWVLAFLLLGLLGLAVVLTFNRSYWIAIVLVVPLLFFLINRNERERFIRWGVAVVSILGIVLLISQQMPESSVSSLVRASFDRAETLVGVGILRESSAEVRRVENAYAVPQVAAHPMLGIGLGASYRPWDPRIDWQEGDAAGFDGRAFIHNGHLWIMMKTGLLGYSALLWLSLAFIWRGFKHWDHIRDAETKGFVVGFTLAYLGIFITALVNSTFMEWYWTPLLGIMMGANEVAFRRARLHKEVV